MLRIFLRLSGADIRFIAGRRFLMLAALTPFVIILLLLFVFPLLSDNGNSFLETISREYYSLVAITLISSFSMVCGIVLSYVQIHCPTLDNGPDNGDILFRMRIAAAGLSSLILSVVTAFLTDPVSSEGWLRKIYLSFLYAFMAPSILFILTLSARDKKWKSIFRTFLPLFFLSVPVGLLLHNPWNRFMFFSPFYWISWAWVVPSSMESLVYGGIAIGLTIVYMTITYRLFYRRNLLT